MTSSRRLIALAVVLALPALAVSQNAPVGPDDPMIRATWAMAIATENLVYWTRWLVAVGALVGISQVVLLARNVRAADDAATAARDSAAATADSARATAASAEAARELASLERPWLIERVDTPTPWRPDKTNIAFPRRIAALVHMKNCGRTPAFIVSRAYALRAFPLDGDASWVSADPPYPTEAPGFMSLNEYGVGSNESHSENAYGEIETPEELARLAAGKCVVMCFGRVDYRDAAGAMHTTRFAVSWLSMTPADPPQLAFAPVGPRHWTEHT